MRAVIGLVFSIVLLFSCFYCELANSSVSNFTSHNSRSLSSEGNWEVLQRLREGKGSRGNKGKTQSLSNVPVHHDLKPAQLGLKFRALLQMHQSSSSDIVCRSQSLGAKVVVFSDEDHLPLLKNWLIFGVRLCNLQDFKTLVLVVCLDEATFREVESWGLTGSYYPLSVTLRTISAKDDANSEKVRRSAVWIHRVLFLQSILQTGNSVLLVDLDALWIRNPLDDLLKILNDGALSQRPVDIVASRGSWPPDVNARWGATLCFGFVYFRNSSFVLQVMQETLSTLHAELRRSIAAGGKQLNTAIMDDQGALNRVLIRWNVEWRSALASKSSRSWWSWSAEPTQPIKLDASCHEEALVKKSDGSAAGVLILLAANQYRRECLVQPFFGNEAQQAANRKSVAKYVFEDDQVQVLHCLGGMRTGGKASRKIMFLRTLGLWMLDQDLTTVGGGS